MQKVQGRRMEGTGKAKGRRMKAQARHREGEEGAGKVQ